LNVKLHHFRDYVTRKEITIHPIGTSDQLADYLTKPVKSIIQRIIMLGMWTGYRYCKRMVVQKSRANKAATCMWCLH
jgi:hypothetical protein